MTVEALKHAVEELSEPELSQFADWLNERRELAWDRKMELDFVPGGPAQSLFDELSKEIQEGKTLPIDETCARKSC